MEIINQGIVHRAAPTDLCKYESWPTVCKDENGTFYAVSSVRLKHIDPFGAIYLYKSTDQGKTWSAGQKIADTPYDDRDPGVVYLGNGKLLVSFYYHSPAYYITNEDHQWTDWQKIAPKEIADAKMKELQDAVSRGVKGASFVFTVDHYGENAPTLTDTASMTHVPVGAPHGVTVIRKTVGAVKAGDLLYTGRESYSSLQGIPLLTSSDQGKTWKQIGGLDLNGIDRFYEAYAIQLNSGRILAAFRVQGEGPVFSSYTCYSDDGGQTFTKPEKLSDGAPPHLLELSDGRVLVTYGFRNVAEHPTGIFFKVSSDGGETWGEEQRLTQQPDVEPYGDLGYPCSVECQDGTIFTAYYQHWGQDAFPSILYTKWRLNVSTEQ